jgi:hypothetical protein
MVKFFSFRTHRFSPGLRAGGKSATQNHAKPFIFNLLPVTRPQETHGPKGNLVATDAV